MKSCAGMDKHIGNMTLIVQHTIGGLPCQVGGGRRGGKPQKETAGWSGIQLAVFRGEVTGI